MAIEILLVAAMVAAAVALIWLTRKKTRRDLGAMVDEREPVDVSDKGKQPEVDFGKKKGKGEPPAHAKKPDVPPGQAKDKPAQRKKPDVPPGQAKKKDKPKKK